MKKEIKDKNKCNRCKKKIKSNEFYCLSCKEKEIKKIKQRIKINEKRRLKSALNNFEEYLKSGRRTY